jgi:type VII secretion-associated protein (TIGR03931 family)
MQSGLGMQSGGPPVGGVHGGGPPGGGRGEPERNRGRLLPWLIIGAVVLVAAVATVLVIALNSGGDTESGRAIAQYEYKFLAPNDWVQTGGSVPDRKVVVRPADAQNGNDLVVVQEYQMNYDATADRARLANELSTSAQQAGPQYSGFNSEASFAGKTVMYYREAKPTAAVEWYVAVKGNVRVHVGCQYAGVVPRDRVDKACEQVVRTLEIVT